MSPEKRPSLSIFFPAYNDAGTIASLAIVAHMTARELTDDYEVIVVEDGSPDHTGELLDEMAGHFPWLKVVHHQKNRGYGGALRSGFATASKELVFYTDDRSPKLAQIRAHPRGTLLMWSALLGWQLRLRVTLAPMDDGLEVSSRWTRLKLSPAAHDYLSPMAPGTPLGQPSQERGSRAYFAVVSARVTSLDWLELHADGHRRALFDDQGARWVQP